MRCISILVVAILALSSEAIFQGQPWTQAPYMARLQFIISATNPAGGQGGGAIISNRHILTSAFVLTPNWGVLNVWIGGITRTTQRPVIVSERRLHGSYQANPRLHDIGIIILAADIAFDRTAQPIALPPIGPGVSPYLNEQGTAIGFSLNAIGGNTQGMNSEILLAAFLRVTTAGQCATRHPSHQAAIQFCGEDTRLRNDVCAQDVGGPFIVLQRGQEVLLGVTSVSACLTTNLLTQPSLFTRVSAYRDWINQVALI